MLTLTTPLGIWAGWNAYAVALLPTAVLFFGLAWIWSKFPRWHELGTLVLTVFGVIHVIDVIYPGWMIAFVVLASLVLP